MTCYFPNGQVSKGDRPCNADIQISHCCGNGTVCLDNGYCANIGGIPKTSTGGSNFLYRGTCTDSSFSNLACPQRCKDINSDAGTDLYSAIHGENGGTGQFCCAPFDFSTGKCNLSSLGTNQPFGLPASNVIWNWSDGSTMPLNTQGAIAKSQPTDLGSVSMAATSPACPTGDSHAVAIGAGVGVPLGILLIVALGALLFETRQRKQIARELAKLRSEPPQYSPAQMTPYSQAEKTQHPPSVEKDARTPGPSSQLEGTPIAELAGPKDQSPPPPPPAK